MLAVLFCFLVFNIFFSATQGAKNITLALTVIAYSLLDFARSVATRALHIPGSLTLVTLLSHDAVLLMCLVI